MLGYRDPNAKSIGNCACNWGWSKRYRHDPRSAGKLYYPLIALILFPLYMNVLSLTISSKKESECIYL